MTLRALALVTLLATGAFAQQAQLDSNKTLFCVMAAINAAGYDTDAASPNNHPLRAQVRSELAARNLSTVAELKRFFAGHRQTGPAAELAQYISFALAVDGTDQYQWRFKLEEIPPDALRLEGLGALMTRFHREANLDELWTRVQPVHDQALERYHSPVTLALQQISAYLRVPATAALGRTFRIYIDLLGAPHQTQARSYGDDFFVVLTPSPEVNLEYIRQAYIGFQVDPYATKYAEKLEKKRPLIDLAQPAPLLPEAYKGDFLLLATKCLSRAVDARLAPASRREEMIRQALGEGYILAPYFHEALQAYEKQEASLRIVYPDMIDAIDLNREDKRLAGVEFLTRPVERLIKVAAPEPPVLTGVAKMLEEAEDLYLARKLEPARAIFVKASEQATQKPLQAKAYYGLARIAILEKNPELAERLYQRVLELTPEPAVEAWSRYYLGRLSGLAGDDAKAAEYMEQTLKIEGASKAARDAAEKALKELRKGQ